MTIEIINTLQLPEKCLLNKKLTKAFFKRNFDLSSSEKNLLDDPSAFISMEWIAAVSPGHANVPAWSSPEVTFEEIQVITVKTTPEALDKVVNKIIDFVQKYIPYHCLLVVHDDVRFVWNVTYKRINQNDPTKRTMDKKFITPPFAPNSTQSLYYDFLQALRFSQLVTTSLKDLYDSYVNCFVSLQTAQLNGTFVPRSLERTNEDILRLEQIAQLEKDINRLIGTLKSETQLNKRVELNMTIQKKRTQIENLKTNLTTDH